MHPSRDRLLLVPDKALQRQWQVARAELQSHWCTNELCARPQQQQFVSVSQQNGGARTCTAAAAPQNKPRRPQNKPPCEPV